jgi:O-antigen/teichoic acid export membrane protein
MLKQRFLVQFGTSLIIQILGMLAGIVVARIAGPSIVGILSYGLSYVSVLGFINGLFGSAHIKLVSEGRDHKQCMAVYSRLQAASSVVYLFVTIGWFCFHKYILHYHFESRQVQIVIIISLFAYFLSQYEQYMNVVYTAKQMQAKANIPTFIRSTAYHLGRIVIVYLGYRAVMISLWNLLLVILVVPYIYYLLKEYPIGKYDPKLAKEYFRYAAPILIIVIINSITQYSDKLFLAYYTNTTQLGYYSAAYSIGGMFMLIAMPVGNIFFPLFSSMISKGNWDGVNTNIRKYHEFIILFIFPLISIIAIAGGPPLLLVLGNRYQPSIAPFSILLFSTYIVLLGLPYGNVITGMGKFYLYAWTNVIKLAVFFVSITIFLSPKFLHLGATGLALNLLVLSITGNSVYLLFIKKYVNLRQNAKNNLRHLVIIILSALAYFISGYAREWTFLWWLILTPLYLLTTYAILILTGLLNKIHLFLLLDALNLKKTFGYVNNEMKSRHKEPEK